MGNHVVRAAIRKALRSAQALNSDALQRALVASLLGIAAVPPCAAADSLAPATDQPAAAAAAGDTSLSELVVTGIRFNNGNQPVVTALQVPIDIKDVPQSVMAITGDVIDFASMKTFQDVYKVDASGGTSWTLDSFPRNYYRGFRQQGDNTIRIDGFRMSSDLQLDLAPYDSIEIVKGPTSTLYGQNQLGGTLNAISKAPRDTFGGDVSIELGSFDDRRATADVYGPLASDGRLQYRVVAVGQDSNSFLDLYYHKIALFAPTLLWQIDDSTELTTRFNWQDHKFRYNFGIGVQCLCSDLSKAQPGDIVLADIPRSVFFGQSWNVARKTFRMEQATLEHKFSNDWHLRVSAQTNHLNEFSANDEPIGVTNTGTSIYDALYANEKEDILYAGEAQLYGDVNILGTKDTLFIGADYQYNKRTLLHGGGSVVSGFNVFAPNYNLVPPMTGIADYSSFYGQDDLIKEGGVTMQAFVRPTDKLTVLLAGRYDSSVESSAQKFANVGTAAGDVPNLAAFTALPSKLYSTSTHQFTTQDGITYAVTPNINAYASYGQSFVPRVGVFVFSPTNPLGVAAPPEDGRATEVGAKGEFFDKRIFAAVALFDMVRSNVTSHHSATSFVDILGKQESKGMELSLQGRITPEFNLFTSIAAMNPKYVGGPYNGLQAANSDRFGISVWATYQFLGGVLKGFGVSGGIVNKDGRHSFGTDTRYANGQFAVVDFGNVTELDARVFYDSPSWRAELGVTNLTNAKYYSPAREVLGFGIDVNPPRSFIGKLIWKFGKSP
jgi:iron complex outermembrane receptor protein